MPTHTWFRRPIVVDGGTAAAANQVEALTVIGTLTVQGSISASGVAATFGTVSGTEITASVGFFVTGAAGSSRDISWRTAGVDRWIVRANATAEGGGNSGSDFEIIARADDGSNLESVLTFTRSSGAASFGANAVSVGALTTNGGLQTFGANDSGGVGFRLVLVPNA